MDIKLYSVVFVVLLGVLHFADSQTAPCAKRPYEGYNMYKVLEVFPRSKKEIKYLGRLIHSMKLDLWRSGFDARSGAHILVSRKQRKKLEKKLRKKGISSTIITKDVASLVQNTFQRLERRKVAGGGVINFDLNDFNTFDEMMDKLDSWTSICPAGLSCFIEKLGDSFENRPINMFTIRKKPNGPYKEGIYIDCLTHAREWLAGTTCMKIINHLLISYDNNPVVKDLVDRYNWYIVPVVNPDGYAYTFNENQRFWKKNRQPNQGSSCVGTDVNRNFDVDWNGGGSSTNKCTDQYRGTAAGSAPEAKAIMDQMQSVDPWFIMLNGQTVLLHKKFGQDELHASFSIHSYGRMWLHPNAFYVNGQCVPSPDDVLQDVVGDAAEQAMEASTPTSGDWRQGRGCDVLWYEVSGSTFDYVYEKAGVTFSFSPELRGDMDDTIADGQFESFEATEEMIGPAFLETWDGIIAAVYKIEDVE